MHKFLAPGSADFEFNLDDHEVEFLIVGGGGGVDGQSSANRPGGGGGGGFLQATQTLSAATHNILVADGSDDQGLPSSAFGHDVPGGGAAGRSNRDATDGSSGGGGGSDQDETTTSPGEGIAGFGHDGGDAVVGGGIGAGGGGGGAGGPGTAAFIDGGQAHGGAGGPGRSSDIDGTLRWYGGGGGGSGTVGGAGGDGGGAEGRSDSGNLGWGVHATANTGGGAGGGRRGSGGSGIVIVRYRIEPDTPLPIPDRFTLANPDTGSSVFTGSTTVHASNLPVPDGYDRLQFNEDPDFTQIDPNGWEPIGAEPLTTAFASPLEDGPVTVYAWFTNSAQSVKLQRAKASIIYTESHPVAAVRAALSRERDGFTVQLPAEAFDVGSESGNHDGKVIGWFRREVEVVTGPGTDQTDAAEYLTLDTAGAYSLRLRLVNQAGNVTFSAPIGFTLADTTDLPVGDYYVAAGNLNAEAPFDAWTNAAASIQEAVDRLNFDENDGAVIRIAAGFYFGTGNPVVNLTRPAQLKGAAVREEVIIDGGGVHRGILATLTGQGDQVVLENLTVARGFTSSGSHDHGAGVYLNHTGIAGGMADIRNCVFLDNYCDGPNGHNRGGGLSSRGASGSTFHTHVRDSLFYGNTATNRSSSGGGAHLEYGRVTVENSRFENNRSMGDEPDNRVGNGGGLTIMDAAAGSVVRHCEFIANRLGGSGYSSGSGLQIEGAATERLLVEASRFLFNDADPGSSAIGAKANAVIRNCLIVSNTAADYASAITDLQGVTTHSVAVENTTIAHNSGGQAALRGYHGMLFFTNSIIYHNDSNHNNVPSANWSHTVTTPAPSGWDTETNLTDDPWMGEPPEDLGYRLPPGSPVIDKGINLDWMDDAFDLAGRPRLSPSGIVDLGAFEWYPPGTILFVR